MSDDQLAALRSLRNGNFSAAAQQARGDFQLIPREVEESTRDARLGKLLHTVTFSKNIKT